MPSAALDLHRTQRVERRPVVDAGRFASIGTSSRGRFERKLAEARSAVLGQRASGRRLPSAGLERVTALRSLRAMR
ncbi:hypothetical protein WME99_18725 [Sorangium sp. So ce136]|uniref:hypothetical protein n=1 Tax=Sorangium sp. So ce136 TaxID=3133284 RepID=UPI003F05F82D